MMKAAQDLAATKDFASAKKAVAALQDAAKGNANAAVALKWEKVASLPDLMKQVPNVNSKLKMNLRGKNFKSKAEATAGYSAVLAAIAGAMADTSAAKNPDQVKWYEWSVLDETTQGRSTPLSMPARRPPPRKPWKRWPRTATTVTRCSNRGSRPRQQDSARGTVPISCQREWGCPSWAS